MKSIIITTATAAIASSLATVAIAQPSGNDPMVSEQISYADLNLSSPDGQHRLRDRISSAAYRLCLVDPGPSPSPATADDRCFRRAVNDGLSQMGKAVAAADNYRTLASAAHR